MALEKDDLGHIAPQLQQIEHLIDEFVMSFCMSSSWMKKSASSRSGSLPVKTKDNMRIHQRSMGEEIVSGAKDFTEGGDNETETERENYCRDNLQGCFVGESSSFSFVTQKEEETYDFERVEAPLVSTLEELEKACEALENVCLSFLFQDETRPNGSRKESAEETVEGEMEGGKKLADLGNGLSMDSVVKHLKDLKSLRNAHFKRLSLCSKFAKQVAEEYYDFTTTTELPSSPTVSSTRPSLVQYAKKFSFKTSPLPLYTPLCALTVHHLHIIEHSLALRSVLHWYEQLRRTVLSLTALHQSSHSPCSASPSSSSPSLLSLQCRALQVASNGVAAFGPPRSPSSCSKTSHPVITLSAMNRWLSMSDSQHSHCLHLTMAIPQPVQGCYGAPSAGARANTSRSTDNSRGNSMGIALLSSKCSGERGNYNGMSRNSALGTQGDNYSYRKKRVREDEDGTDKSLHCAKGREALEAEEQEDETIERHLRLSVDSVRKKRRNALTSRAKDVLQQWFLSHIHHPYPSLEEKRQLAQKCGTKGTQEDGVVTVQQVNNWFINARGRMWRPKLRELIKKEQENATDQR